MVTRLAAAIALLLAGLACGVLLAVVWLDRALGGHGPAVTVDPFGQAWGDC